MKTNFEKTVAIALSTGILVLSVMLWNQDTEATLSKSEIQTEAINSPKN